MALETEVGQNKLGGGTSKLCRTLGRRLLIRIKRKEYAYLDNDIPGRII